MEKFFKIFLLALFILTFDLDQDIVFSGRSSAYAGFFPDNRPFSIPPSHMKRYRKAGKKRLTSKNLRSSKKYKEIVVKITEIYSVKTDNNYSNLLKFWQIGEKIAKVTSDKESSRKFNEKLYNLLSIDCRINFSDIYDSVRFYRCFHLLPELSPSLTWKHYKVLIRVKEKEKRDSLHKEAVEKRYSVEQLLKLAR